jgi:signal peptidase
MKVLYKGLYWVFMMAVLSLGALLIVSLLPIAGNVKIKIVKSGSMEPTIRTGAIVVDKPETTYQVGDVVTFGADTKTQIPTTHRILAISGEGAGALLTTKGDANNAQDPVQTPVSAVHGKVLFSVPYLGYILNFARQPLGFVLLIGLPATLIIFDELVAIWGEVKNLRARRRAFREARGSPVRPPALRVHPQERPRMNVLDLRRRVQ